MSIPLFSKGFTYAWIAITIEDVLFGIRIKYQDPPLSSYGFMVPPCYTHHQVNNPDQLLTNEQLVAYFDHKCPKLLIRYVCISGFLPQQLSNLVFESLILEVQQLGFKYMPFETLTSEFIVMTISNVSHLELLVLKLDHLTSSSTFNTVYDELTFCTTFWSTLKIIAIDRFIFHLELCEFFALHISFFAAIQGHH